MRDGAWLAIAGAAIGLAVAALYVGISVEQGESETGVVVVFTGFLVASSVLALASVFMPRWSARVRLVTLGAATGGFLTAGVLGIFSIGLPLLVAGVLCLGTWVRVARSVDPVPDGAPLLSVAAGIATGAFLVVWLLGS